MHSQEQQNDLELDLPELLARLEDDRELLREVYEIFLEEFPLLNRQLKNSIEQEDRKQVQILGHTLKGMLSSLSFIQAAACAMNMEHMGAHADAASLLEELGRLERHAAAAQASLAAACYEAVA